MDIAIAGALLILAVVVFVGLAVGWWVFRKTLSLLRKLLVLGLTMLLTLGIMGGLLAIYLIR